MSSLTDKKHIIYAVLLLLVLGTGGYFAYRYFLPSSLIKKPSSPAGSTGVRGGVNNPFSPPPAATSSASSASTSTPQVITPPPGEKLIQITNFPVVAPALNNAQDKILYYKKDGGDLYRSDRDGRNQEKIGNLTIIGLTEAAWSPEADRSIALYLAGETMKSFLLIGTSTTASLPEDITSASWAPDGRQFGYTTLRNGRLLLTTADASGKNQKTIFSTPVQDLQFTWIGKDRFSFLTAPSGLAEGYVFAYSAAKGVLERILGPLFGLDALWAPDGKTVITSATNTSGKNLAASIRDRTGKILMPALPTLARKCVWQDARRVLCAVPRFFPSNIVLPDDYLSGEFNSSDQLVLIDTEKKEAATIFNERDFDMSGLVASKDKKYLFFVNRMDGTLWSLRLQ